MDLEEREKGYRKIIKNMAREEESYYFDRNRLLDHYYVEFKPLRYNLWSELSEGKKVLDLGCGKGAAVYGIARHVYGKDGKVIGADFLKDFIDAEEFDRILGKLYGFAPTPGITIEGEEAIDFVQLEAEELPFKDNCFDIIISVNLLPYIMNKVCMLSEIVRVLKKGGRCYISTQSDSIIETKNMTNKFAEEISGTEWKKWKDIGNNVYGKIRDKYDKNAKNYNTKTFLDEYFDDIEIIEDNGGISEMPIYLIIKKSSGIKLKKHLPEYVSFVIASYDGPAPEGYTKSKTIKTDVAVTLVKPKK